MSSLFKDLTPEEQKEYRQWARDNYEPGMEVNPVWHPIVRDEIELIKKEQVSLKDNAMWSLRQEQENNLMNDELTQGQKGSMAQREAAYGMGADRPDDQWLLTDRDTWVRNPYYTGEEQPHPEDCR